MSGTGRFARISEGLTEGVAADAELIGLVLLGSASEAGAARRDEWSDHDFFAIAAEGRGAAARASLGWLPEPERIALVVSEGEIGRVVLYDDGHVLEFALAEAGELTGAPVGQATVAVDDARGTVASLVRAGQQQVVRGDGFDPAMDAGLVLVKLLIGVGRARRGEVLTAGEFIRVWAVRHLVRAVRGRGVGGGGGADGGGARAGENRDAIDPVRRFEQDFPEWGARIADALAQPVEPAARALFDLVRARLEPDWPEFPTAAADAVARRLGWF